MLNARQQEVLLKPLNTSRVAKRTGGGKSLSYLEAWDVKAHLIRTFGFGGWSWDVLSAELAFEDEGVGSGGKANWSVGYKVIGRLTIHGITEQRGMVEGTLCDRDATYTEAAVGFSTLPARGEAHDMAVKTAESDALKRAAINLGDQFGLSLYNKGQTAAVVKATIAGDGDAEKVMEAAASTVVETEDEAVQVGPVDEAPALDVSDFVDTLRAAMSDGDVEKIIEMKADAAKTGIMDATYEGKTIAKLIDLAVVHAGKTKAGREALGGTEVSE